MSNLMVWVMVFGASLFILIKAADYFTDSAAKIGLFLKIPHFIVGVTIVAIGTSLPELISSIFAVLGGNSEIVIGNVVGSNITNIFLVIGIAGIIGKKMKITYELIHVDLPMIIGSAFLLTIASWDGIFTPIEGLLFIASFILYSFYIIKAQKEHRDKDIEKATTEEFKERKLKLQTIAILIVSSFFIYIGAKYVVESIIKLSEILEIGIEIIAISAVALGTSLPELMVSISAARKGNADMAIGNVLGSNIFNTFMVMGIPALMGTLIIPQSIIFWGLPIMIMATFLYFFITHDNEITLWEGWLLVIFYLFFIGKLFNWL